MIVEYPILMICREGTLVPANEYWRGCMNERLELDARYFIQAIGERSLVSHNHYFACLNEAWRNLPEDLMDAYPTPVHLRKKLLIQCGYADETSIVCPTKALALRVAAFARPGDEYAVVTVRGCVVRRYTAQSQSMRAMGRKVFQESKDAVLAAAAALIKVSAEELSANAKEVA